MTTPLKGSQLPQAIPGEAVSVVGFQGLAGARRNVQALLPPAAFNIAATRRDMDAGTSTTTQVTPAAITPILEGFRSQFIINWKNLGSSTHTVTVANKAAITGVAAKTTANILTATFSNFRTFLPYDNIRIYYDDSTGTPALPGDTLLWGFVMGTEGRSGQGSILSQGRLSLSFWQNRGGIFHKRAGAGSNADPYRWVEVPDDDPDILNDVYGAPQLHGWLQTTTRAFTVFGGAEATGFGLVSHGRDELAILTVRRESSGVYNVGQTRLEYRTPRADITGAQVVTALSSLTGANRLDAQFVKNLAAGEEGNGVPNNDSVSTVKLQDAAVTGVKVADNTLGLVKLSIAGGNSGQIVRLVDGVPVWSNETIVDALGAGTIITESLASEAVTGVKIAPDTLQSRHYADLSVINSKIGEQAITQSKMANNSVGIAQINPAGGSPGQIMGLDTNGDPDWINPASVATVADASVSTAKLIDRNVTGPKIALDTVGNEHMKPGAIGTTELAAVSVTAAKIAPANVNVSHINPSGSANQVLTMSADGTSVGWADPTAAASAIADGSLQTAKYADNSVTGAKIPDTNIVERHLGPGAVTRAKIGPDAIDGTKVADAAIGPEHHNVAGQTNGNILTVVGSVASWQPLTLPDNIVTAAKIQDGTLVNAKYANNSITGAKIHSGEIDTAHLANDSVTAAKISNGAVTLAKLDGTGALANYIIKRNSTNTAWEVAAPDTQTTGVSIVDTAVALASAQSTLAAGAQIRIGTEFTSSGTTYYVGQVFRRTSSESAPWQNLSLTVNEHIIETDGVVSRNLAANSVTGVKIADNAIQARNLADGAVTASKIADGSIEERHLSLAAVRVTQLSPTGLIDNQLLGRRNGDITGITQIDSSNLAPGGVNGEVAVRDSTATGGMRWGSAYPLSPDAGDLVSFDGTSVVWQAKPTWTSLGGNSQSIQSAGGTVTRTLSGTNTWNDYDMIWFWGLLEMGSAFVPVAAWNTSAPANPIRLAEHVTVYRGGDNSYTLATDSSFTGSISNYIIEAVYGYRWEAYS